MSTITDQSFASDTLGYLQGYTTPTEMCREEPKIPTMSEKSAEIYSNIRQCIPNTKEKFSSIKKLESSITEIKVSFDKIAELKKNETFFKVGSVIAIAVSVTLIAAIILIAIFVPILAPGAFMFGGDTLLFSLMVGIDGNVLPFAGAVLSCIWAYIAFNGASDAQKKLSTEVAEAKGNHEKFKTYFNANYSVLKKEIEASAEIRNKFLGELTGKKGADVGKLKKQHKAELHTFQQALSQLEDLHNFYTRADSIVSIDKFQL